MNLGIEVEATSWVWFIVCITLLRRTWFRAGRWWGILISIGCHLLLRLISATFFMNLLQPSFNGLGASPQCCFVNKHWLCATDGCPLSPTHHFGISVSSFSNSTWVSPNRKYFAPVGARATISSQITFSVLLKCILSLDDLHCLNPTVSSFPAAEGPLLIPWPGINFLP